MFSYEYSMLLIKNLMEVKIVRIWRKYKMKRNLRILYRTSLFRDELIYKPNIGYKYFESYANYAFLKKHSKKT